MIARAGALAAAAGIPWVLALLLRATAGWWGALAGGSLGIGLALIIGGGLVAIFLGPSGGGRLTTELAGLASGAAAVWYLGTTCGMAPDLSARAAAIVWGAWFLPWCWVLPLRALGMPAVARLAYLASLALLLATPFLVPPGGSDLPRSVLPSPYGTVPGWVTQWNPLARLHGSLLPEDWFHGPLLYPRVGERQYSYPEWSGDLMVPALSAVVALLAGALIARRARRAAPSG